MPEENPTRAHKGRVSSGSSKRVEKQPGAGDNEWDRSISRNHWDRGSLSLRRDKGLGVGRGSCSAETLPAREARGLAESSDQRGRGPEGPVAKELDWVRPRGKHRTPHSAST